MKNQMKQLLRSMAALVLIFSFNASVLPSVAMAQEGTNDGGPLGFGIVLGDPSALTAKYNLDAKRSIDAGLAFDFDRWVLVYGDWLYHVRGIFSRKAPELSRLTPYLGIGGVLVLSNRTELETRKLRYFSETSSSRTALGIRLPLGLEWRPASVPVGVFVEVVPGLVVIPGTYGFAQGGIGIRYFF
jgi:hypothetical protein